jgi:hypothetical protein
MSSQKNFNFRGHSLGTVTINLNRKGISLELANPLIIWCLGPDLNRHGVEAPRDFKSLASTSSATQASQLICRNNNDTL